MLSRPGSGRPMDSKVLRPMRMGLPMVDALKRRRSSGSRHGRPLARPMTPFSAIATTSETRGATPLDLHSRVEDDDVAEGHAEKLRRLRAVLLHTCKQPPLQ